MVGRFVDIGAKERNLPAARFGHISTPPVEIVQPNKHNGLCYCVDMHSRTGFSGSPVFLYRMPFDTLEWTVTGQPIEPGEALFLLLGIHCAQFPEQLKILRKEKEAPTGSATSKKLFDEYVEGMSGMTCVIPAWRILELLDCAELKEQRAKVDAAREKSR